MSRERKTSRGREVVLRAYGNAVYVDKDGFPLSQIRVQPADPNAQTVPSKVTSEDKKKIIGTKEREIICVYNNWLKRSRKGAQQVKTIEEVPRDFYTSEPQSYITAATDTTRIQKRNKILEFLDETIYTVTSWGSRKKEQ